MEQCTVHGAHEVAAFLEHIYSIWSIAVHGAEPINSCCLEHVEQMHSLPQSTLNRACVAVPISEQKEQTNLATAFLEHMLQGFWDSAYCDFFFFVLMAAGISTLTYLLTYSSGVALCAPRMQLLHGPTGPLHLLRRNSQSMCSVFCALGKQLVRVLQLSSSISSLSCEENCLMFSSVLSVCSGSQLLPVLQQSCSMSSEKAAAPVALLHLLHRQVTARITNTIEYVTLEKTAISYSTLLTNCLFSGTLKLIFV